jgi:hypothetical protein
VACHGFTYPRCWCAPPRRARQLPQSDPQTGWVERSKLKCFPMSGDDNMSWVGKGTHHGDEGGLLGFYMQKNYWFISVPACNSCARRYSSTNTPSNPVQSKFFIPHRYIELEPVSRAGSYLKTSRFDQKTGARSPKPRCVPIIIIILPFSLNLPLRLSTPRSLTW